MYHEYIFYPFFTHSPLKIVKKVDVVQITECFYRMLIAMGLAVCRPVSGSLIAEMFTASHRGVANGVFSWGVYYGYGLAFVFGRISRY